MDDPDCAEGMLKNKKGPGRVRDFTSGALTNPLKLKLKREGEI